MKPALPFVSRTLPFALPLLAVIALLWSPRLAAQGGNNQALPIVPMWELATWPGENSLGHQTQEASSEDWFYSITESVTATGTQDGYVVVGYSGDRTVTTSPWGCTECEGDPDGHGCSTGTIAQVGPSGTVEWLVRNGLQGTFFRVEHTSDGGFVAVGETRDRPGVLYNPVDADSNGEPDNTIPPMCFPENAAPYLLIAAKYDHDGVLQWQHAYGLMEDPDDYHSGALEQMDHDIGWDIVERQDGSYRIVGTASDPDSGMNARAFVVDVEPENGFVLDRAVYGEEDERSELMGVERWGNKYVAVGTQYDGSFRDPECGPPDFDCPYGDLYVVKLGETLGPALAERYDLTATSEEQDVGYDVAFAGDGSVLVAGIIDCTSGGFGGECFRFGAGGEGTAEVFHLNRSDLSDHATNSVRSLGAVKAYDLFIRLNPLSGGGIAAVSTQQLGDPIHVEWDNTDAAVWRLTSGNAIVAADAYDARTDLLHTDHEYYPADYNKHQECLYDVAEAEDGGLVISGNNSSNYDDGYVVRFFAGGTVTTTALAAPTLASAHLVYPALGVAHTFALTGNLNVGEDGRLWVDPEQTLAFGQGKRLKVDGGEIVTDDAVLTEAVAGQGWRGVYLHGGATDTLRATTVEQVGCGSGPCIGQVPIAVTVSDAEAVLSGVTVSDNDGTGVAVGGTGGVVVVTDGSRITGNGGVGLYALAGGAALVEPDGEIFQNGGGGVRSTGYGSAVRLNEAFIHDNDGPGAVALDEGSVFFSDVPHGVYVATSFVQDNDGGVSAEDGAGMIAGVSNGTTCQHECDNQILRNALGGAYDAKSVGGSTNYAEANYWGSGVDDPSDLVLVQDTSSFLSVLPILTVPPSLLGGGPQGGGAVSAARHGVEAPRMIAARRGAVALRDGASSLIGGLSRGSGVEGDAPPDSARALAAEAQAVAAGGEMAGALPLVLGALQAAETEDGRAIAFQSAAALLATAARVPEAAAEATAVTGWLTDEATREGASRPWALRALAVANASAGEAAAARADADALEAGYDGTDHALFAMALRVRLAAEVADEAGALAALSALSLAYPESDEVAVASVLVAVAFPDAEVEGALAGARGAAPTASAVTGVFPEEGLALAVWPNPSVGRAEAAFTLPAAGSVELVLYDALGRRIAVLASGAFAAGRHEVALNAEMLPAGLYVVRLAMRGGEASGGERNGAAVVRVRRLTIVR